MRLILLTIFMVFIMTKIDTKKILFTLSGIALITLLSLFIQNYVHAAPKEGKKYGSWIVTCEKDAKNKKNCFLTQTLTTGGDKEGKNSQHFASFKVGYLPGSKDLQMIQILPFGISLQAGSTLVLTGDKLVSPGVFTTCQSFGCIAVAKIVPKDLTEIVKAKEAYLGIMSIEGKQLNIKIDTKGLKEGVEALKAK